MSGLYELLSWMDVLFSSCHSRPFDKLRCSGSSRTETETETEVADWFKKEKESERQRRYRQRKISGVNQAWLTAGYV